MHEFRYAWVSDSLCEERHTVARAALAHAVLSTSTFTESDVSYSSVSCLDNNDSLAMCRRQHLCRATSAQVIGAWRSKPRELVGTKVAKLALAAGSEPS